MIVDKNLKKYIALADNSILEALEKISSNAMRLVYIIDESGVLEGILTDGDFRRWVVRQKEINLSKPVINIANHSFLSLQVDTAPDEIESYFSQRIESIPLVDQRARLVAVATRRKPEIMVGSRVISNESPVFVIAEIGNNHNGSYDLARKLIDKAVESGADCVKFQMRNMEQLYLNAGDAEDVKEDLGSQYILDLLNRFQLKNEELIWLFDYCTEVETIPLCTPWDKDSVELLAQYGLPAFKIASADFTNYDLLDAVVMKGKPVFCSTGMSTERELRAGTAFLKKRGGQVMLLHCNSTYPAPYKDINLNYLDTLKELSDYPVGYSGHERGFHVAVAAVAKGAKVIEKHFTLDRSMEGNDHKVSLEPNEFQEMVRQIRDVESSLGTGDERALSQGELINRENLSKSLVINCDLEEGQIITDEMIEVRSPGKGLQPNKKTGLIGMAAKREFYKGDFFFPEDLTESRVEPRDYQFTHPFGVPVRYHDIGVIASACRMDILEIHLSYMDLEEDIDQYFSAPLPHDLVVHSPELFAGDHILDLCADDLEYRNRSILELKRVIEVTNRLKKYFPNVTQPRIVVNVGGFSADYFLPVAKKQRLYELVALSLAEIDQDMVEIIPQTMPPFPWHFGGQRYHNLFVSQDDITEFCKRYNYRVCFDVSHSKLACNQHTSSFNEFIERVAPFTAHLHIADARGSDGEGLQIDEGEIDFTKMMKRLTELIPTVSFIPEIWQGHKNDGQGFWVALDRLERHCSRQITA